jgi:hypothetical protein
MGQQKGNAIVRPGHLLGKGILPPVSKIEKIKVEVPPN